MWPREISSRWLMQRRNVLLPEPDAPIRHCTWPTLTSRSMPLRTSRLPKCLCTFSATTMLACVIAPPPDAPADCSALHSSSLHTPSESSFQQCLSGAGNRGDEQVPEGRHDEHFDRAQVHGGDVQRH